MLQAFVDGSGVGQQPVFVMAGYVSNVTRWMQFSDEWATTLAAPPKIDYFKFDHFMNPKKGEFKLFTEQERNEKIALLKRVIDKHVIAGVGCVLPYVSFDKVIKGNTLIPRLLRNKAFYTAYGLIHQVAKNQHILGIDGPIDFIFDEDKMHENKIRAVWDQFKQLTPAPRHLLGRKPEFKKDTDELPLQAADLIAGMIRLRWREQYSGLTNRKMPCENTPNPNPYKLLVLQWNEATLKQQVERMFSRYTKDVTFTFGGATGRSC